jgi:hypothetical protein
MGSFAKLMKRLGFVRLADYGLVLTPDDRIQSTRPHVLEDLLGTPIVGWLDSDLAVAELPQFGSATPKHAQQFTIPSAALIASLSAPALPKFIDSADPTPAEVEEPEPQNDWEWEVALARARAAADEAEAAAKAMPIAKPATATPAPVPARVAVAKSPFAKPIAAAVAAAPVAPAAAPITPAVAPIAQPVIEAATEPGFKHKPQPNLITSAVKLERVKAGVVPAAIPAKVSTRGIPRLQVVKSPIDTQPGSFSARRNKTAPMTAQVASEPSRAPRARPRAASPVEAIRSKTQPMAATTPDVKVEPKRLTGRHRLARGTDPIGGALDEPTAVTTPPVMQPASVLAPALAPKPLPKLVPITALPSIKQRMAKR